MSRAPGASAAIEREHVLALELHLTGRRLDQPEDAAAGRGLAAARFADQAERLALLDRKRHVVHRAHDPTARERPPAAARELLDQIADVESAMSGVRPPGAAATGGGPAS